MSIEDDIALSARLMRDIVWPTVSDTFGGGRLETVEGLTDPFATRLDQLAGIDTLWHKPSISAPFGVAARVLNDIGFDTFTVRSKLPSGAPTELHKRWEGIIHGAMYPEWMIHAYIKGGVVTSCALARTCNVLPALSIEERRNPQDGNWFKWVTFEKVPDVLIWKP